MISIRELQHIRKEHGNHQIKDDIISLDAKPVRIKESKYRNKLVGFHWQNISNTSLEHILFAIDWFHAGNEMQ